MMDAMADDSATRRAPLSVIVPTRDRPKMLERCVSSVRSALQDHDELIVVDSASVDREAVRRIGEQAGARVLRCEQPGVNRARNLGWRNATHATIGWTDDDVWVDLSWADEIVAAFGRHPDAAFIAGRIDLPPGQEGTARPVAIWDEAAPRHLGPADQFLGHNANLAMRRDALAAVGGYDDELGAGGRFRSAPESDLFDRLLAHGYEGWYDPAVRAWHDQWRGSRDLYTLDWRYGIGNGARLAKLVRTDRHRARVVARDMAWTAGINEVKHHLTRGSKRHVLNPVVRMAGGVVGFARALPVPVRDGLYAPRR